MLEVGNLLKHYGYWIIFFNVFLEAIGLPLPAVPILVAGGAACAFGTLAFSKVISLAIVSMLLGDFILFLAGRYTGWAILGFLCRFFDNPEACILRSAESFYKHGRLTLLFSKFIPAVNTMAPPMAGSMNMRVWNSLAGTSWHPASMFFRSLALDSSSAISWLKSWLVLLRSL